MSHTLVGALWVRACVYCLHRGGGRAAPFGHHFWNRRPAATDGSFRMWPCFLPD